MASAETLDKLFRELSAAVASDVQHREITAIRVAEDISAFCSTNDEMLNQGFISSRLFDEKNGILVLLQQIRRDEFPKAKEILLDLLTEVIPRLGLAVLPHIDVIKATCKDLSGEKRSKVQKASLGPLIQLFHLCDLLDADEQTALEGKLELSDLWEDLADRFLFSRKTEVKDTALGHAMELMGTIANQFPLSVPPRDAKFGTDVVFQQFVGQLERGIAAESKSRAVVPGALRGLAGLLTNFTTECTCGTKSSKCVLCKIYAAAIAVLDPRYIGALGTFGTPRAAAQMFSFHGDLFKRDLLAQFREVYGRLKHLCEHKNSDLKRDGFLAMDTFLRVVLAEPDMTCPEMVRFFLADFMKVLRSPPSRRSCGMALRGVGLLAAPLNAQEPDQVGIVYQWVVLRCAQSLRVSDFEPNQEILELLPVYFEALASVSPFGPASSEALFILLDKMVQALMDNVVFMRKHQLLTVPAAIERALRYFAANPTGLRRVLKRLAGSGLYAVSILPVSPETQVEDITNRKKHRDLWRSLFDGFSDSDSRDSLYDEVIKATLHLVDRFEIGFHAGESADSGPLDPEDKVLLSLEAGQPKSPRDNEAFNVLVEFVSELLLELPSERFCSWASYVIRTLVGLSMKPENYESSGIYNLLHTCVRTASRADFFAVVDDDVRSEAKDTAHLLRNYAIEVQERARHYQNELQAACIRLVLVLPPHLLGTDIGPFIPTLQTALVNGTGFEPLALAAFDALEEWTDSIADLLKPHLAELLPNLEAYLKPSDNVSLHGATSSQRTSRGQENASTVQGKSPEIAFYVRAVRVLGKLGNDLNFRMLNHRTDKSGKPSWIAWTTERILTYHVEYFGQGYTICLDDLLPLLVKQSTEAKSRKTKIVACEALHTTITALVARTTKASKGPSAVLWRPVFAAVIQLAGDIESVVVKLFEPLMMQIVRWVSGGHGVPVEVQKTVFDCVLDELVNPNSSALRRVATKCITEIFRWGEKEISKKELESDADNAIAVLVQRLCSLATHPDKYRRLGAAMIINSVYRNFRENETLVSKYFIVLIVTFVNSLKYQQARSELDAIADQTAQAARHLVRMVQDGEAYSDVARYECDFRVAPPGWEQGTATLEHLVRWCLEQTFCRTEKRVLDSCWLVIRRCCPVLVSDAGDTVSSWMEAEQGNFTALCHRLETPLRTIVAKAETPVSAADICNGVDPVATAWLCALDSALQNFNTVLGFGLVPAGAVFECDLEIVTQFSTLVSLLQDDFVVSGHRVETMDRLLRGIADRGLRFIGYMIKEKPRLQLDTHMAFATFVVQAGLSPERYGFRDVSSWRFGQVPALVERILRKVPRGKFLEGLVSALDAEMRMEVNDVCTQSKEMLKHDNNQIRVHVLCEGYQLMHSVKMLATTVEKTQKRSREKLSSELLGILMEAIDRAATNSPATMMACRAVFNLALAVHIPRKQLFDCILAVGPSDHGLMVLESSIGGGGAAAAARTEVQTTPSGEQFVHTFRDELASYFLRHAKHLVPLLFEHAANPVIMQLLHAVLREASKAYLTHTRAYETEDIRTRTEALSVFLNCAFGGPGYCDSDFDALVPLCVATSLRDRLVDECALISCIFTNSEPKIAPGLLDHLCKHDNFSALQRRILALLKAKPDVELSLGEKSTILDAVPYCADLPGYRLAVDTFVRQHLLDVPGANNLDKGEYIDGLTSFLRVAVISGDLTFFEGVALLVCSVDAAYMAEYGPDIREAFRILAEDEDHPDECVLAVLRHSMVWSLPHAAPVPENSWAWLKPTMVHSAVCRVTVPLLHFAIRSVLLSFCADTIESLITVIDEAYLTVDTDKCTSSHDAVQQCERKASCLSVLGALFQKLTEDDIRTGVIEKQFVRTKRLGDQGPNMFYKSMCKSNSPTSFVGTLKAAREWSCCTSLACNLRIARQRLACAAFDALASMHVCAQPPEKLPNITNKFLLHLDAYPALIDTKLPLHSVFLFPRTGSEKLLRRHGNQWYSFELDIMNIDLRGALVSVSDQQPRLTAIEHVIAVQRDLTHRAQRAFALHGSFATFLRAVDAVLSCDDGLEDVPGWLVTFLNSFDNAETLHVQTYLAGIILHRPNKFKQWSERLTTPLVNFVAAYLDVRRDDDAHQRGVDTFAFCLITVLLEWGCLGSLLAVRDGKETARRLLCAVMQSLVGDGEVSHTGNNVFLLSALLGEWQTLKEFVPYDLIFEMLKKGELVGTLALQAVLANGLKPWEKLHRSDLAKDCQLMPYLRAVLGTLTADKPEVYLNGALCVGATLKFLRSAGVPKDMVSGFIKQMRSIVDRGPRKVSSPVKFVQLVHRLYAGGDTTASRTWIEAVCDKKVELAKLSTAKHEVMAYDIMIDAARDVRDLWATISKSGFRSMIAFRNDVEQRAALHILANGLEQTSLQEFDKWILSDLRTAMVDHDDEPTRATYYDFLKLLWQHVAKEGEGDLHCETVERHLIKAFDDPSVKIRRGMLDFWSSSLDLGADCSARLCSLLERAYSPDSEPAFISSAAYLLLDLGRGCEQEVGFTSLGGDFDEYKAVSFEDHGGTRNVHMSSIYTASRKRATAEMCGDDMGFVSHETAQSFMFSQTQSQHDGAIAESMFTVPEATFGTLSTQNTYGESVSFDGASTESQEMQHVERRRVRIQARRNYMPFAMAQVQRNKRRSEKVEKRSRKTAAQLFRKYRDGQLPDTQIKHTDLVLPYQALAFADDIFAQKIFGLLATTVLASARFGETFKGRFDACLITSFGVTPAKPSSLFVDALCHLAMASPCTQLDASHIRRRCMTSGILQHGIILLEHQVAVAAVPPPSSKRRKADMLVQSRRDPNDTRWAEVAALHKALGDGDALAVIYSEFLGPRWTSAGLDAVPQGIKFEAVGDFDQALPIFDAILKESADRLEECDADLLAKSRDECAYQLCRWNELAWDSDADDLEAIACGKGGRRSARQLMDCSVQYAVSEVVSAVNAGDQRPIPFSKHFVTAMDDLLKTAAQGAFVSNFGADLALLYCAVGIHENSASCLDSARYYAAKGIINFCRSWNSLHPLMQTARTQVLREVQGLVEVEEILDVMSSARSTDQVLDQADVLMARWIKRPPASVCVDPYPVWESAVSRRELLFGRVRMLTQHDMEEDATNLDGVLRGSVANTLGAVRRATEKSATHALGTQRLKATIAQVKSSRAISPLCRLEVGFDINSTNIVSKMRSFKKNGQIGDPHALLPLLGALASYTREVDEKKASWLESNPHAAEVHRSLVAEIMQNLAFADVPNRDRKFGKALRHIPVVSSAFFGGSDMDTPGNLCDSAMSFMTSRMLDDDLPMYLEGAENVSVTAGEAHLHMAIFAKRCLDEDVNKTVKRGELCTLAIRHTLAAMARGSCSAALKFPAILAMACSDEALDPVRLQETFEGGVAPVSSWLFLRWISQLIPHLSKPSANLVQPIFTRLSEEYPGALVYPVMISFDQVMREGSPQQKSFAENLRRRVVSPLTEQFIEELEGLHDPQLILFDFKDEEPSRESVDKLRRRLGIGLSRDSMRDKGGILRKFSATFKNAVEKLLKSLPTDKNKRDRAIVDVSRGGGSKWDKEIAKCTSLKDYSVWLARFQGADYADRIEMPGQYVSTAKPRPETHVTIDSVAAAVVRMKSMRKPKRITFRGSNARNYHFLAKGGEDLRQDERIIQVFEMMNSFFADDVECASRSLHLRTYPVFPMTTRIGLLGWVDNTAVLKEVMDAKLQPNDRDKVYEEHKKWIPYHAKGAAAYATVYQKASREEALQRWNHFQACVTNKFALRDGLVDLASCPQACLELKRRFGRSLAAMSAAQYILGIGDRHRSNTLVDVTTGEVVGIDFGHAFGSACTHLRIPELIPFRLTPQLVHVFHPYRTAGWFRLGMVHSMSALRKHRDDLLAALQVFVEDPLVEWTDRAAADNKKHHDAADRDGSPSETARNFCRRLIATAGCKLDLYNPVYVMESDLAAGHKGKAWFESAVAVIQGTAPQPRYEALQRGVQCASVSEQVDCLIDMASDPNILARTWFGWDAWA